MAPQLPLKVIGVRPGEKLHEIMITEDDARNTAVVDNGYVIKPPISFWEGAKDTLSLGTPVAEGFVYSSNTNPDWASKADLLAMIKESSHD